MNKFEDFNLYCVDCGGPINEMVCSVCGRKYDQCEDIPCFFSKDDFASDEFSRYLKNYDIIAHDDVEEDIMPEYYKIAQATKTVKYCGEKIRGKILDVGSGKGYFLEMVPHGEKIGIDISLDYLKILNSQSIKGILANAERLPFKNEFDVVVLTDILEHVYYPDKVMKSVYDALKNDGIIIVRVPYKEDLSVYDRDKGFKYEFCHLRSFDEVSLKQVIGKAGFIIKCLHYDGFSLNRLRNLFKKRPFRYLFGSKYYQIGNHEIVNFPNWIGRLLTRPIELVLIAKKGNE